MHVRICTNPRCRNIIPPNRRKYCCDECRKPAHYYKGRESRKTFETFMLEMEIALVLQRRELEQMRSYLEVPQQLPLFDENTLADLIAQRLHAQPTPRVLPAPARPALEVTRADAEDEDDFGNFMATYAALKN